MSDNSFSLVYDNVGVGADIDMVQAYLDGETFQCPTVEEYVFHTVGSVFSLDVSKSSTGYFKAVDGSIELGSIQLDIKGWEDSLANGRLLTGLRDRILKVMGDTRHYDLICIEEAILGVNAKTSSLAYALNYVIDMLLSDGVVTCDRFIRDTNSSWKSSLRNLTGTSTMRVSDSSLGKSKSKRTSELQKREVISCLQAMNFAEAFSVDGYSSWTKYLSSGVQDTLDATGLALGVLYKYYTLNELKVLHSERKVKVYKSLADAERYSKYDLVEVPRVPANKVNKWVSEVGSDTGASASYLMVTDNLGAYGIKHGILIDGLAYLVVTVDYVLA